MQKAFLVINKETQVASYLQHRSILDVTEEHRSLIELSVNHIEIVDVDKFLYIYYQTDDSDLSFRSDMNILRTLMSSAFFHASEAIFILVNNTNPLLEDLIYSALRDSKLTKDKIEIISHNGSLMLADVGKYLAGNASGQTTSSSYRDVYVREADKEEKERYVNSSSGLNSVLPVLTDMSAIYTQRASVEAISAGRVVTEKTQKPTVIKDFTRVNIDVAKTKTSFVISGERWSQFERAVYYLVQYFHTIGSRCLIINVNTRVSFSSVLESSKELDLMDIKFPITPENPIAFINIRYNQLGYVVEYLNNIRGIDNYIFFANEDDYKSLVDLVDQLSEVTHAEFIAHYCEDSVRSFVDRGLPAVTLFLYFGKFKEDFNLQDFKGDLKNTMVVEFPVEDVDYTEFYEYCIGGEKHD